MAGYCRAMMCSPGKVCALGVSVCLASFSLHAQEAPLKTIEAVLSAFVKANGGEKNIESIISVRGTGRIIRADGAEFELVVVRKAPRMKRVTTIMGNFVVNLGFDGTTSWRQIKATGAGQDGEKVERLEGAEKKRFESDVLLLDVLFYPDGPGIHHELVGVEYVGRVPCYVVKSQVGGNERLSYVDSRTFRIPKVIEIVRGEDGETKEVEQILEDYVKVHGMWIAKTIIRNGTEPVTAKFDEVKINDGIFDSVFSIPESD